MVRLTTCVLRNWVAATKIGMSADLGEQWGTHLRPGWCLSRYKVRQESVWAQRVDCGVKVVRSRKRAAILVAFSLGQGLGQLTSPLGKEDSVYH